MYIMIFHDDDVMHTDMIRELYTTLANNEDVIAVGTNAKIVENGTESKEENLTRRLKHGH